MITNIDYYMDGGTAKIITENGEYYFDRRLGIATNDLYDKYPDKRDAQVVACRTKLLVMQMLDDLMDDEERHREMRFFSEEGARILIRDITNSFNDLERQVYLSNRAFTRYLTSKEACSKRERLARSQRENIPQEDISQREEISQERVVEPFRSVRTVRRTNR